MNNTASEQYRRGKVRLVRWLDYRARSASPAQEIFLLTDAVLRRRFGFSEYNSDTYAPIAFNPLVTVAGIAPDED